MCSKFSQLKDEWVSYMKKDFVCLSEGEEVGRQNPFLFAEVSFSKKGGREEYVWN